MEFAAPPLPVQAINAIRRRAERSAVQQDERDLQNEAGIRKFGIRGQLLQMNSIVVQDVS